ncbi:MAG: hypothetical protein ACR2OZ_06525 [Verrucomicrobiales bacterium]
MFFRAGIAILILTASFLTVGRPAIAQEKPVVEPIAVTDQEKLRSLVGQKAIVKGVVKRVESMRTLHRRVWFTKGNFILFIRKRDFEAHPDWKLDDLTGHEVFAGGDVHDYNGQLELLVYGPEQIADTPEKIDLAKVGGSNFKGGSPAATAGPQPKTGKAAVTQCLAVTASAQPQLVMERFEATMDAGSRSGAPPLVIESYSGKDRTPATTGLDLVRQQIGGWPSGRVFRVRRAGGGTGPGLPHGLATALLLRSMFDGFEIPPRLLVCGDFTAGGDLMGGREELLLLPKSRAPADSWLLVPDGAETALFDHFLDGQWSALTGPQIFSAKDLDAAIGVVRALGSNQWQAAVERFAPVQRILTVKPGESPARVRSIIQSPPVRFRAKEIAQACPAHLGARVLIRAAEGRLPKTYSTAGTGLRLRQFYLKLSGDLKLLREDKPEARRKLRAFIGEFESLAAKADPGWQRFSKALEALLDGVKDAARFGAKDTSPRAKKATDALKTLTAAAKLEYDEALKFRE